MSSCTLKAVGVTGNWLTSFTFAGLRCSHLLEQPKLLDLDLASRLERRHLLEAKRDFSAGDVQLRAGADDLSGLRENQLLLRCHNERVLKVSVRLRLKRREILLPHVAAKRLGRARDVGVDRIAIGALQARRDQRGAVDSIVQSNLIAGLIHVGAGAEARAAEDLLAALLPLRA